jgi:hypothetical protein
VKGLSVSKNKKRNCFTCDGTGQICGRCGEAEGVCSCDDDEDSNGSALSDCEKCKGTGIASADITKADLDKKDKK